MNQELPQQWKAGAARPGTRPPSRPGPAGSPTAASPASAPGTGNIDFLAPSNAHTLSSAVKAITHREGAVVTCRPGQIINFIRPLLYGLLAPRRNGSPKPYLRDTHKLCQCGARPNSGITLDTELLKHNVW